MDKQASSPKALPRYSAAELADELLELDVNLRHLQAEIDLGRGTREVLEAFDWITARVDQIFEYIRSADFVVSDTSSGTRDPYPF